MKKKNTLITQNPVFSPLSQSCLHMDADLSTRVFANQTVTDEDFAAGKNAHPAF